MKIAEKSNKERGQIVYVLNVCIILMKWFRRKQLAFVVFFFFFGNCCFPLFLQIRGIEFQHLCYNLVTSNVYRVTQRALVTHYKWVWLYTQIVRVIFWIIDASNKERESIQWKWWSANVQTEEAESIQSVICYMFYSIWSNIFEHNAMCTIISCKSTKLVFSKLKEGCAIRA